MSGSADETAGNARWLDRLAGAAVVLALGGVLGAATPALVRASGLGAAPEGYAELPRSHPRQPGASSSKPRIEFLDAPDDDGLPSPTDRPPGQSAASWAVPRMGRARTTLELRTHAAPTGLVVGEVPAGTAVTVVREEGAWVLIAQSAAGDLSLGWAPKSEVAIR